MSKHLFNQIEPSLQSKDMSNHLDVFIASNNGAPSFSPLDSDGILNAIHTEQVVGTLVRMRPSGRYEGYLARDWKNSEDFKTWTFNLRPGLTCEDGSPIDSKTYARGLTKVIRLIKKHSEMPLIDRLQGFSDMNSDVIAGIETPDTMTIRFAFTKPVMSGLLEYLALPYLGFYCDADFNPDGSWKDNRKITSSGAYKLDNWTGDGPVKLRLRSEWFKSVKNPPSTITITTASMEKIKAPPSRGFVISFLLDKQDIPENYQVVHLMPTIFHGLVVSDKNNSLLRDPKIRQLFRDEVRRQKELVPPSIASATPVNRMYPHMSRSLEVADVKEAVRSIKSDKPIEILIVANPSKSSRYILDIAQRALRALKIPYVLKTKEQNQRDLMLTYRDPTKYDIRPVSVDAGGGIENQLVKFMFCSNLGVSFLDPSKRICALVDDYEKKYGDVVPQSAMEEYIQRFDTILEEDASLIPIMKTGHSWLFSPDIEKDSVSPTMGIPYFDLVNLHE